MDLQLCIIASVVECPKCKTEGDCQSMAGVPIALSWVCTAAVLATSSLQAAAVHSIVHFLQLHQKYRSSQNQPQHCCNLSSQ